MSFWAELSNPKLEDDSQFHQNEYKESSVDEHRDEPIGDTSSEVGNDLPDERGYNESDDAATAEVPKMDSEEILEDIPDKESEPAIDSAAAEDPHPAEEGKKADSALVNTPSILDRQVLLTTPNRPIRPSKFVFLSDQKTIPTDLRRLQVTTMKRRRDLMARMHDLDCQVAKLTSLYAEEKMDLDLAIRDTVDRSIRNPLEASVERLVMERESSVQRGPAVRALEERVAELENLMTRHIHVVLSDAKRDELDRLHHDLHQEIIPSVRIESAKSDKIEGGIIRRYEAVAGTLARQFHQEAAAHRSSLEMMKQKVLKAGDQDEKRGEEALRAIKELRLKIQRERVERVAADEKIREDIKETIVFMKRALLAAVGGMS